MTADTNTSAPDEPEPFIAALSVGTHVVPGLLKPLDSRDCSSLRWVVYAG